MANLPPGCRLGDVPGHGITDEIFEEGERDGENGRAIPDEWDGHYEQDDKARAYIDGWIQGRGWWVKNISKDSEEITRLIRYEFEN